MAKILFGNGVSTLRGAIAGSIFSVNANGAYVRNRGTVSNPNTVKQQGVRLLFATVSQAWRNLTDAERQTWRDQAPNYPYVDNIGQTHIYTGQQLFCKLNMQLRMIEEPISTTASVPDLFVNPAVIGITVAGGNIFADIAFSDFQVVVPAGTIMVAQATRPMSAGVNRPKRKDYRQIALVSAGTNTSALNVSTPYVTVFGTPSAGSRVFFQVFLVSRATGQASTALSGSIVL